MSPLALRMSRRRNGVSQLHGEVAREMWQPMFRELEPDGRADHPRHQRRRTSRPSWRPDARAARPAGSATAWLERAADPAVWEAVRDIPDAEPGRRAARRGPPRRATSAREARSDRLQRGEQIDYVGAIETGLDPDALTIGFARRFATYKRVHLLTHDPERRTASSPARQPVQLLLSGKAHPTTRPARTCSSASTASSGTRRRSPTGSSSWRTTTSTSPRTSSPAATSGSTCRARPMEASGTSGMKATFNGGLKLSVLDGWWAEAYDGAERLGDPRRRGHRPGRGRRPATPQRLYDLLEQRGDPALLRPGRARRPAALVRPDQARADHVRAGFSATPHDRRVRREDLPRGLSGLGAASAARLRLER